MLLERQVMETAPQSAFLACLGLVRNPIQGPVIHLSCDGVHQDCVCCQPAQWNMNMLTLPLAAGLFTIPSQPVDAGPKWNWLC
jgi:hypothetical protein